MHDDSLYRRIFNIMDRKASGYWLPIVKHLAIRRHPDAMVMLADWYDRFGVPVPNSDSYSSYNLYRRAWRMGNATAAQHMAMSCFNDNDMLGFRLWLRRAAKLGDVDCARYIKRFETRLPHRDAKKIGRLRPHAKRDGWG